MRSTLEKRLEKSAKSLEEQRREKQRKLARWEDKDDKYHMCFHIMMTMMVLTNTKCFF